MPDDSIETTRLLRSVAAGDAGAADRLLPILYDELHATAERLMQQERAGHTLQPTALIHEAYMRLIKPEKGADWDSRAHFVRVAVRAMRQVLVDHARARKAKKRGSDRPRSPLLTELAPAVDDAGYVLEVDDALQRLAEFDNRLARIVEMRFFGGMTNEEVASSLELSSRTVERDWRLAQAWLLKAMGGGEAHGR